MKRYCLTLDLKNDQTLINEYIEWHKNVWPEILKSINDSGIINMEIYRFNNRLFMIMETEDNFTFERKASMDSSNDKVQEWEKLMWRYQQPLSGSREGEKWMFMDKVFALCEQLDTQESLN